MNAPWEDPSHHPRMVSQPDGRSMGGPAQRGRDTLNGWRATPTMPGTSRSSPSMRQSPSRAAGGGSTRQGLWRLLVVGVAMLLVGAVALSVEDRRGPDPDSEEDALLPQPVVLRPLGPRDGKASIGLPVTVDPAVGLEDGSRVTATGSGFHPAAARRDRAVRHRSGSPGQGRASGGGRRLRHNGVRVRGRQLGRGGRRGLHSFGDHHHTRHRDRRLQQRARTLHRRDGRQRRLRPLGRQRPHLRASSTRSTPTSRP